MNNKATSDSSAKAESTRRFKFHETAITDIGGQRKENQDAFGIAHSANSSLYIVADGMGGARGGAMASAIAVNLIANTTIDESGSLSEKSLSSSILRTNEVIHNQSKMNKDLSGMGTTVVALGFIENKTIVAHVGDSRIYRLRDGELVQLTHDHTLVQELIDSGAVSEAQAEDHPTAHMLTRSLGPIETVEPTVRTLDGATRSGDRFLLCSDGLHGLVSNTEIQEYLITFEPELAAQALIDLALERGGGDNITVEVIETVDVENDSISIDAYPEPGKVRIALSEGDQLENLEEIVEQVDAHLNQGRAPLDTQAAGSDEDISTEDTLSSGKSVTVIDGEDIRTPLVERSGSSGLPAVQAAGFFCMGLLTGVVGLSALQGPVRDRRVVTIRQPEVIASAVKSPADSVVTSSSELPKAVPGTKPAGQDTGFDPNKGTIQALEAESKWTERAIVELDGLDQKALAKSGTFGESREQLLQVASVTNEKDRLREQIGDVLAKLKVLELNDESEVQQQRILLNDQSMVITHSLDAIEEKIGGANIVLQQWLEYKKKASGKQAIHIAESLEQFDDRIKSAREVHQAASAAYVASLDRWSAAPNDLELAGAMSAKGKELRRAKNALQQVILETINSGVEERARKLAELRLKGDAYEKELRQLRRQDVYLQDFSQLASLGNEDLEKNLLEKYLELRTQLSQLESRVTQREEVAYALTELVRGLSET